MDRIFQFGFLAFTSLFTMVTPFGIIPYFTSLTKNMTHKEVQRIAFKGVLTAFIIMVLFAFAGNFIFEFFHISVNGLRIVGGILFFLSGYDMLQAKMNRLKEEGQSFSEFVNEFAITPLGIPIICGPGSITMTIVLFNDARNYSEKAILFGVIIVVLFTTYLILVGSRTILKVLGDNGNKVLMRIMGLILMVIAVDLMFAGLKPMIQEMIGIKPN
ncbi:MAG: NAAT family transporter [Stygiobacter sp.]|nr:MAG: NAAT family transporter [Stygiobacter sp.]